MSAITQTNRLLKLASPLGDNTLILTYFSGHENLSGGFEYLLNVLSKQVINADQLIGKAVTVLVNLPGSNSKQYFNGLIRHVTTMADKSDEQGYIQYQLQMVSQLSTLENTSDCRIYQDKTIPEIIEDVLHTHGIKHIEKKLKGAYPKRAYCTQYNESARDFIERLMAEVGIYYFFKHSNGKHTMIISDDIDGYTTADTAKLAYRPDASHNDIGIRLWFPQQALYSGRYAMRDYDFKKSSDILHTKSQSQQPLTPAHQLERYHYPGGYYSEGDKSEKKLLAQLEERRQQAQDIPYKTSGGVSNCPDLRVGTQFEITGYQLGKPGKQVITQIKHDVHDYTGQNHDGSQVQEYSNEFGCIPAKLPFRPPYNFQKPLAIQLQTAKVVGAKGKEIDIDEYGRVKVQFHWDRLGKYDDKSSCRIRVQQPWAGHGFGFIFHPRVGQEVAVGFINGDPDEPVILGSYYNHDNKQPYTLPDNATQSGIKTHSTPKGGQDEFNELRFEDKKGSEEIYIHAQKDFTQEINDNKTVTIKKGNDTKTIKQGNRTITLEKGDGTLKFNDGEYLIEAKKKIVFKVGSSTLTMLPSEIVVKSPKVKINKS